jgi:hypothetical protein
MAATVGVFVYTGTSAGTESTVQTGIGFLSIDSAAGGTGDSATRSSNPVVAGTTSFEKHVRLKATVAPAVSWGNVKFWTDGTGTANVGLRAKLAVGTGGATPGTGDSTPTATAMTGDADAYSYTSGAKGTWDAATYSAVNTVSKALLLQLAPTGAASPGAWPQETLNYSYDEV